MNSLRNISHRWLPVLLALATPALPTFSDHPGDDCAASGDYHFVCGPQSAEDLVHIPGTDFIIASGYAPGAPFFLIDARKKSWSELRPRGTPPVKQQATGSKTCPGAPDVDKLVTHGLNLRPGKTGHSILYAVGHGAREAIEIFDVDSSGPQPVLTWTGCIMMPQGLAANSVASFADGSLLATVPLSPGKTIVDAMSGQASGSVYEWTPGQTDFTEIKGTEMPYPNGVEVSADGKEFYVASSVLFNVVAFSRSNPTQVLRSTKPMEIVPDNLHMGPGGELLTAGLVAAHPVCGNVGGEEVFSLEEFATCPRPFVVVAVDPVSMKSRDIARGAADPRFSNVTMALAVGKELWIGTFAGDRVAYREIKQDHKQAE